MNFDTYKFRCSFLPNFLVQSRTKSELLSETTKTELRKLWIKEKYGREEQIANKYTIKGIMTEPDSMDLVQKALGQTFFKNNTKFENDYIHGTPDIVDGKRIIDIKSKWDLTTLAASTRESEYKAYFGQLMGYMWLTGSTTSSLINCLPNTPEEIINDEAIKASYKNPELENNDAALEKFRLNYIFDDIDVSERIQVYNFDYDEAILTELVDKIVAGREYMNNLTLKR